jgi:hypothetical protein
MQTRPLVVFLNKAIPEIDGLKIQWEYQGSDGSYLGYLSSAANLTTSDKARKKMVKLLELNDHDLILRSSSRLTGGGFFVALVRLHAVFIEKLRVQLEFAELEFVRSMGGNQFERFANQSLNELKKSYAPIMDQQGFDEIYLNAFYEIADHKRPQQQMSVVPRHLSLYELGAEFKAASPKALEEPFLPKSKPKRSMWAFWTWCSKDTDIDSVGDRADKKAAPASPRKA